MKQYKVWVHIEEIDEENDTYEEMGMPVSESFHDTYEQAVEAVSALTGLSEAEVKGE